MKITFGGDFPKCLAMRNTLLKISALCYGEHKQKSGNWVPLLFKWGNQSPRVGEVPTGTARGSGRAQGAPKLSIQSFASRLLSPETCKLPVFCQNKAPKPSPGAAGILWGGQPPHKNLIGKNLHGLKSGAISLSVINRKESINVRQHCRSPTSPATPSPRGQGAWHLLPISVPVPFGRC